jgi:hypothetical protein
MALKQGIALVMQVSYETALTVHTSSSFSEVNVDGQLAPFVICTYSLMKKKKVQQSRYTPWRRLGGRGGIAPTHSRPRH